MPLRTLQVDVTDLAETMDFAVPDGVGSYLDLRTGDVAHPADPAAADADPQLLPIPPFEANYKYGRMLRFVATLDPELATLFEVALEGHGAFRRFKNLIHQHGIADAWYGFQLGLDRAEAMAWLGSHGVTVIDVSTRMPAAATEAEGATVSLAELLLLGAPDGRTEVVAGRVVRRVPARSPQHSRELFARLAREVCASAGIASPDPTGASDIVDAGRFHLRRHATMVELEVEVSPELWDRFRSTLARA